MKQVIFLSLQNGSSFATIRNRSLANYIARQHSVPFKQVSSYKEIDDESFIVTDGTLPLSKKKKIHQDSLFGAFSHPLIALKSIFHPSVSARAYIPKNFPVRFIKDLERKGITPPGYTAFTKKDMITAYKLLTEQGWHVRLKDPRASGGLRQLSNPRLSDVKAIADNIDESELREHGYVLETCILNSRNNGLIPEAYSGGWTFFRGIEYSYLGIQHLKGINRIDNYLGTTIFMVQGDFEKLRNQMRQPNMQGMYQIIKLLSVLKEASHQLPKLVCTRFNYDILKGSLEGQNSYASPPGFYVTDQSFRPGGASISELLAITILQNKKVGLVQTSGYLEIGKNLPIIPSPATIFAKGIDPDHGPFQTWGMVDKVFPA